MPNSPRGLRPSTLLPAHGPVIEPGPRLDGLPPVWDARARVLVLGSFPGAASLRAAQYYAHPRNGFWPVMAAVLGLPSLPNQPYDQRLLALREQRVALWDAVASCRRAGSLDAAIESAELSDLDDLVRHLPGLRAIACNGALAYRETLRALASPCLPVLRLPSTSPAHAGMSQAEKSGQWREAIARHLS